MKKVEKYIEDPSLIEDLPMDRRRTIVSNISDRITSTDKTIGDIMNFAEYLAEKYPNLLRQLFLGLGDYKFEALRDAMIESDIVEDAMVNLGEKFMEQW